MATEAPGKLLLSDVLQQTTAALSQLDTAALERLVARLDAVQAGAIELQREPVEAIRASHTLLGSVLAVTEKNMQILDRLRQREGTGPWAP
ncbi:MAG TPA: hypothetical protein VH250_13600 [Granulicella sp.]|jgi:hypothetical protein|nr:hypothetical protein [Granulicella sp.]